MWSGDCHQSDGMKTTIADDTKIREIGRGKFAVVYLAQDKNKAIWTAQKVSPDKTMLRREAGLLQRINHPLFANFCDYYETAEEGVLCMEYIPGSRLDQMVESRGSLGLKQTIRIAMEIADGLRYLHEMDTPMVCRDVKPEHVIIRQDGRVKLVDLGCAGVAGDRSIAGSRGYAAPEQFLGKCACGTYSDVYGLGRVMEFMHPQKDFTIWRELLKSCTESRVECRIPDMNDLLKRLILLEEKSRLAEKGWFGVRRRIVNRDHYLKHYYLEKSICMY